MMDLINCVLKCTGCDLQVTIDDINDPDNAPERLKDLQEQLEEVNLDCTVM
jgi:cohesin complex subunit SA-1/2